jgi:hypothetical protein
MLTIEEQDALYFLLSKTIGEDFAVEAAKPRFNDRTVAVVEEIMNEAATCNQSMKELLIGLIGGAAMLGKGWLKRTLKEAARTLKNKKVELDGYACRVVVKSHWKRAVILSTI